MNRREAAAWMARAACRDADTALFFPPEGEGAPPEALRLCRSCEVNGACLEYALADADLAGIWAGTSARLRDRMRRRARLNRRTDKEAVGW